jgi:hypothetical protein
VAARGTCTVTRENSSQHVRSAPSAFVDDSAVAFDAPQRVLQYLGGGHDIVEQADLSEIEVAREVKSQQIIAQRIRNKPQECDLGFDFQTSVTVLELLDR